MRSRVSSRALIEWTNKTGHISNGDCPYFVTAAIEAETQGQG